MAGQGRPVPPPGRRCKAQAAGGGQCKAYAVGDDYCNFHDPDFDMEGSNKASAEARRKWFSTEKDVRPEVAKKFTASTGAMSAERDWTELETPEDVRKFLAECMNDVRLGRITHQDAQMAAYMANVMLSAMRTAVPRRAGEEEKVMPDIHEIARSDDPRAREAEYPGSEVGDMSLEEDQEEALPS